MVALAGCTGDDDEEAPPEPDDDDGADDTMDDDEADDTADDGDEADDAPDDDEESPEHVDEVDGQVSLTYGETASVSNGVEMTAHGIELYDELGDEVPEERDQFAFLHLEAENTSDEPRELGSATGFELLFGDQQVDGVIGAALFREGGYERIDLDDVQGGVSREGHLLYEVDADLTQADIDCLWQDSAFVAGDLDGEIDVRWTDG